MPCRSLRWKLYGTSNIYGERSPATKMISSVTDSSYRSQILKEGSTGGRTLAELSAARKLGTVKKRLQPRSYAMARASGNNYGGGRRARELLSCQTITENLHRSMADVDERGCSWVHQRLQEALLNYERVLDFNTKTDSHRFKSRSGVSRLDISSTTAGKMVYTMFRSIEVLKNASVVSAENGRDSNSELLSPSNVSPSFASWKNLFSKVCCLVVHIGSSEDNGMRHSSTHQWKSCFESRNSFRLEMSRGEVEACLRILSEQCQQVIQQLFFPCSPSGISVFLAEYLLVMIKCITCILQLCPASSLPAPEQMAQSIVLKVLLPVIDQANSSCNNMTTDTAMPNSFTTALTDDPCIRRALHETANIALDVISWLVKIKHFAIALLCPLVVEVSVSGQECSLSNPIRRNMIETIQTSFFLTPCYTSRSSNTGLCETDFDNALICQQLVYHACLSLISIVEAAGLIQRTNLNQVNANSGEMILEDMDGANIARRIRTLMLTGDKIRGYDGKEDVIVRLTRIKSVVLLASIARCCSFLISSNWELFLSEHESVYFPSQESDAQKKRPLLALLRSNHKCKTDHDEISAALSAIDELIRNMPFKQILTMANIKIKQQTNSAVNIHGSSCRSTCDLVNRIYGAVLATLETLADELNASWLRFRAKSGWKEDEIIVQTFGVVHTIMTSVPFGIDGVSIGLNDSAVRVLSITKRIFLDTTVSSALVGGTPEIQSAAASALVNSMGGKRTQSGSLTILPIPTRIWMHQNNEFVTELQSLFFVSLGDISRKHIILDCLNILQAIHRVAPWASARCHHTTAIICRLPSFNDSKVRQKVCELTRSLLLGRQDFCNNEECRNIDFTFITTKIAPTLCATLRDQDLSVRAAAVSAFGVLSASDWFLLCRGQEIVTTANQCLSQIIELCTPISSCEIEMGKKHKKLSAVRAAAYKSLGEICSAVLGPESENHLVDNVACGEREFIFSFCHFVYNEASKAMLASCSDQNAAVRSMAIFAVGNLARALNAAKFEVDFQNSSIQIDLCNATLTALTDENENVVGNSIRAMGHLIEGLLLFPQYTESWADENGVVELCGTFSECLAARIQLVLSEVSSVGVQRPSWRQRSNAKKHAWGACSGLAPLLSNRIASRKSISLNVAYAIQSLLGCIDQAPCLNVKIVISAVSTLRSISVEVWRCFVGDKRVFGNAIRICIGILSSSENAHRIYGENLLKELSILLSTLLVLASWKDYLQLQEGEGDMCLYEFLYIWLVENNQMNSYDKSYVFQSVKTTLETQQHPNVSLVQRFASRAINEQRKAESSGDNRSEVVIVSNEFSLFPSEVEDSEDEL